MDFTWIESIIYGFVMGLSQILPVSAQAHRALMLKMFGHSTEGGLLGLLVHGAVFAAVYIFYADEIRQMLRENRLARIPRRKRKRHRRFAVGRERRRKRHRRHRVRGDVKRPYAVKTYSAAASVAGRMSLAMFQQT